MVVDVQTLTSSSTILVAANFSATSLDCVDAGSTNHFPDSQLWRNNAQMTCNITHPFSRAGDLPIASDLTKSGSRVFTRRSGTQTAKSQNASTRRLGPGFEPLAPPSAGAWPPGAVFGLLERGFGSCASWRWIWISGAGCERLGSLGPLLGLLALHFGNPSLDSGLLIFLGLDPNSFAGAITSVWQCNKRRRVESGTQPNWVTPVFLRAGVGQGEASLNQTAVYFPRTSGAI